MRYGNHGITEFNAWFRLVFCDDIRNPWYLWECFFMSVSGSRENLSQSSAISEDKIDKIVAFRKQFKEWDLNINDPTIIQINNLRKQPLSEWDRAFCQEARLSQVSFRQITTEELSDIFFTLFNSFHGAECKSGGKRFGYTSQIRRKLPLFKSPNPM